MKQQMQKMQRCRDLCGIMYSPSERSVSLTMDFTLSIMIFGFLAHLFYIRYRLTDDYSLGCHGTIESVMRNILAALKALLAEVKLAPQDWVEVLGPFNQLSMKLVWKDLVHQIMVNLAYLWRS